MNKSRNRFIVIELIFAAFCVFCIVMMVLSRSGIKKKQIAVVVEDSENEVWSALRDGITDAADENDVDIRFVTTGTFDSASDELKAVDEAVSEGCDGILMYPINKKAVKLVKDKKYRVPVLLLGYESVYSIDSISIDAFTTGEKLGEMILDDHDGSLSGVTVGFLTDARYNNTARQIKAGVDSALKRSGYRQAFIRKDPNEDFIRLNRADILIALDENAITLSAGMISSRQIAGTELYGCGFAPSDIYQLDMENIKGLAYPDIFRIGYYGVTEMSEHMDVFFRGLRSRVVSSEMLRRADIFNNREILYTFSHN